MKIHAILLSFLSFCASFQHEVIGETTYNFQETPITLKIGECVNLTAQSYFSTISQPSSQVEIVWKKDSHKITNKKPWLYMSYITTEDGAYYEAIVYNRSSKIKETTDFWLNVVECKANEMESKITTAVCKSSCMEICPTGWFFLQSSSGKKCFKYFGEQKSWSAAQDACQAIGAQLAKVENLQESKFLGGLLKTAEGSWIGLNDRSTESIFVWNFDEKDSILKYLSWAEFEPNNYNARCNIENCVIMSKESGEWSDVICNAFYPFVCEVQSRNSTDWTCISSKCYRFYEQPLMWQDALQFCKSLGGQLVNIQNSYENQIVQNNMTGDSWIGLNDISESDNFVWNEIRYSSQQLQFKNWASSEPNDMVVSSRYSGGCPGEDCVVMKAWQSRVLWYDVHCDTKIPYICEKNRDRLLSSGAITGIVMGCMIAVTVIAGIMNARMRERNRAQLKAAILAAYEHDYSETSREHPNIRKGSFRKPAQSYTDSRRK